jgi:hypothetical protein
MSNSTIQELKRNDIFKFNDEEYKVTRRWIDDDHPLVAVLRYGNKKHWFYWEGLEIEKLDKSPKQ